MGDGSAKNAAEILAIVPGLRKSEPFYADCQKRNF